MYNMYRYMYTHIQLNSTWSSISNINFQHFVI